MSERCDVVIVGGGLLGCAVAWQLARGGASVILLEKDQLNQHASGQNAGSLHFQLEYRMIEGGLDAARRAAEAMPLHLDAARAWSTLAAELGEDVGVHQHGGLMLAGTAEQARLLAAKAEIEREWGLDVTLVDGPALSRLAPYLSGELTAAAFCPLEGRANARVAANALARGAARHGATIRTRARVARITPAGDRWRVEWQRGDEARPATIVAGALVLAAGAWSAQLAGLLGVRLPIAPVALTMLVTAAMPAVIEHLVQHVGTRLSIKQVSEGNVLIGGGWPARLRRTADGDPDLDVRAEPMLESLAANARAAIDAVPALAAAPVVRTWTGTTTLLPDQLPLLGPLPGRPRAFTATGGSAFTLGLTYARLLARLVMGEAPEIDITAYAPSRFGALTVA